MKILLFVDVNLDHVLKIVIFKKAIKKGVFRSKDAIAVDDNLEQVKLVKPTIKSKIITTRYDKIYNNLLVNLLNIIGIAGKSYGIDININCGVSYDEGILEAMFEMYMNAKTNSDILTYQMNFLTAEGVVIDD